MTIHSFLLLAALVSGCTCNKTITEKAPDDLETKGMVIDQPAEGAKLTGAWVTVAGWVAPEAVQNVAAIGAPVDDFYEVTGHVGVPTVAVMIRKDGRFFAPRVPLQDGEVQLKLIPFGKGGTSYDVVTRTVTASQTTVVPATIVIEPAQPKPGEKATLRATTGADLSTSFQWDFDGDGTFEAEGASVTHSWEPGRYLVVARTRVNDVWVSAVSKVTVGEAPKVLASAPLVNAPRCLSVLSERGEPPPGDVSERKFRAPGQRIAVCDGDEVKVFDENLTPLFVLPGLSEPHDVTWDDEHRIYVVDTGHDRIVRFTQTGELDVSFKQGGEFKGTAELPLTRPMSSSPELDIVLADGRLLDCSGRQSNLPSCWVDTQYDEELLKLGVKLTGTFRGGYALTTDSQLLATGGLGISIRKTRAKVVDVASGPTGFYVDFATVNTDGAIDVYRTARHVATWVLPYKATAIGADTTGQIYVGGPGIVELRDFKVLR